MIQTLMPWLVGGAAVKYAEHRSDKLSKQDQNAILKSIEQAEKKKPLFSRKQRLLLSAGIGIFLAMRKKGK